MLFGAIRLTNVRNAGLKCSCVFFLLKVFGVERPQRNISILVIVKTLKKKCFRKLSQEGIFHQGCWNIKQHNNDFTPE